MQCEIVSALYSIYSLGSSYDTSTNWMWLESCRYWSLLTHSMCIYHLNLDKVELIMHNSFAFQWKAWVMRKMIFVSIWRYVEVSHASITIIIIVICGFVLRKMKTRRKKALETYINQNHAVINAALSLRLFQHFKWNGSKVVCNKDPLFWYFSAWISMHIWNTHAKHEKHSVDMDDVNSEKDVKSTFSLHDEYVMLYKTLRYFKSIRKQFSSIHSTKSPYAYTPALV